MRSVIIPPSNEGKSTTCMISLSTCTFSVKRSPMDMLSRSMDVLTTGRGVWAEAKRPNSAKVIHSRRFIYLFLKSFINSVT